MWCPFRLFYLEHGGDGASCGEFGPVEWRAEEEDRNGDKYRCGGDTETPLPAFVVFDPNDECHRN